MSDDLFTAAGIDPAVRSAVIAELRAQASVVAEHGRNALPGGICGIVTSFADGKVDGPNPTSLYSEARMVEIMAGAFRRMLDAAEGIELYRPGNGGEGRAFMAEWCANCTADAHADDGAGCDILADTMISDVDDDDYPRQWRQDGPQGPRCTAFAQRTTIDGQ